ncbi:hypothetical protein DPMN_075685 [Dreissena polymorpha]|uniref:Uncharacterized protein n=1 Tax=Dreissena polymorpha TaxID=45954 RepID=A0A9D3YHQ2_DREPO|nr:hypothetical protein DPMN_075685 [Dreissena polymorpha]
MAVHCYQACGDCPCALCQISTPSSRCTDAGKLSLGLSNKPYEELTVSLGQSDEGIPAVMWDGT